MHTDLLLDRRQALGLLGAGAALAALAGIGCAASAAASPALAGLTPVDLGWDASSGQFVLPHLPYAYDALQPHIDEQTMRLHHTKHHAAYVRGVNAALKGLEEVRDGRRPADEVQSLSRDLAFHGSGHLLHVLFWHGMTPPSASRATSPAGALAERIRADFGSADAMASQLAMAAIQVEGGGWAILAHHAASDRLMILQSEKHQDVTLMGATPMLCLDVWEHAYYLRYRNDRKAYVEAHRALVNWDFVASRLH
jgi:superoxide dismutase, Fe-Mn family